MFKNSKEFKNSKFIISDSDYEILNAKLKVDRSNYNEGKENYEFLRLFENYLYNKIDFREPEDEIKRLKKISFGNLFGNFDTNYYEDNFKKSSFEKLNILIQKLKGVKHLRSSLLYENKYKTKKLIEHLLKPIENKIKNILNSNFIITKIEDIETITSAQDNSSYWHFDPVPMGYGKIFFYFSSSADTDGKTQFLSLRDSLEILERGYNNIPLDQRKKEISDLSKNLPIQIGERGNYAIFFSGLMLHKGSYPTFGVRKILSVNFLRSPYSWRESFDQIWEIDKLSGKWIASNWPKHIYY